jgi:hypothetical protein
MVILAITILPWYSPEFIDHYSTTLKLWFSNFEFNAGIYNLVKQLGLQFDAKPWELIKIYGKITPVLIIGLVLVLTFLRKNQNFGTLLNTMLIILTAYYFLSATVHPWYLIFLVVMGLYADYRYPLVWSAVVVLSYSAYANPEFSENKWLLAIEYFTVFGFMTYEFFKLRGYKSLIPKK